MRKLYKMCSTGRMRMSTFQPEYAFEMSSSTLRFGRGVTKEIGQDIINLGLRDSVCVVTDKKLVNMSPFRAVADSLTKAGVKFDIFDDVTVEPTDKSLKLAIDFCKKRNYKAFVAIGGGSVMDTAKAANVYMCHPQAEFLDFVNAPIGKGLPVPSALRPLIAVPTTAGTGSIFPILNMYCKSQNVDTIIGSETTGVSIFDFLESNTKTGIRDRALRPTLAIIDPDHTATCSPELTAFSGLDVLCHALESFTAVPYRERITGAPSSSLLRPAYQGSNPIAEIWSGYALQQCAKYLRRAVEHGDPVAREQMCLASTAAGVGFGMTLNKHTIVSIFTHIHK
jgi:hydroxyacid-oxoacid transhydrogenase